MPDSTMMFNSGASLGGLSNWSPVTNQGFPDPFTDMASLAMPETMNYALRWCEYIMMSNGTYRQAIDRVLSYFITDINIAGLDKEEGIGDQEKTKYEEFFKDHLGIQKLLHTVGLDLMCFHGDTKVPTREGAYPIRELEGREVDVISEGGVYRKAAFKKFGRQRLMEVTFSDGRKVLATPEHQWIVQKSTGGFIKVPTTKLAGRRILRTVAPRPERNADFEEGVRHGTVYGDGSLYNKNAPNKTTRAVANLFGRKIELLKYFTSAGFTAKKQAASDRYSVELYKIHGLSEQFKTLPSNEASPSYWYGFVCGFLATDGSVDTYGCSILTQKNLATLKAIEAQLPRIGMVAGPIRSQVSSSLLPAYKGKRKAHQCTMYYMTLLKQFMQPDDLLLTHHRDKFVKNNKHTNYGQYIGVKSVVDTGIVDDVYCCVEPETHSFVIDNGIITGNCYGNSFVSVMMPFRRYLYCPKCFLTLPLREVHKSPDFRFQWLDFSFHAHCPNSECKYTGRWGHIDRRGNQDDVKVKRWNPHEIEILWDPGTDDTDFIWKIPEHYKKLIREGHLYHLERVNWEVVQAVKNGKHLKFDKDVVFHLKEDALAGILNRGWGIPRTMTNFRQVWYVQVLHRYNEAIALDYVIPFRLITPVAQGGGGSDPTTKDPLLNMNMGGFMGRVRQMLREHRRDPAMWHTLPFPVQYQALGGDATQLAPRELLDQGLEVLLNNVGVPVELYKGSLQIQSAPAALRLFESNWTFLVHNLNRFLQFVADRLSRLLSWEPINIRLTKVTHADDLNKQMAKLQLMMGGQLSKSTGLQSINVDYKDEVKRQTEEARFETEQQMRLQEDMDQLGLVQQVGQMSSPMAGGAGMAGGAPPGGDPAAAGGAPPAQGGGPAPADSGAVGGAAASPVAELSMNPQQNITPEELQSRAMTLAQQLLGMPEGQRQSEMTKLKQVNPTLHSLVKSTIENIRQQAKTQGGSMLLQQQFGGT